MTWPKAPLCTCFKCRRPQTLKHPWSMVICAIYPPTSTMAGTKTYKNSPEAESSRNLVLITTISHEDNNSRLISEPGHSPHVQQEPSRQLQAWPGNPGSPGRNGWLRGFVTRWHVLKLPTFGPLSGHMLLEQPTRRKETSRNSGSLAPKKNNMFFGDLQEWIGDSCSDMQCFGHCWNNCRVSLYFCKPHIDSFPECGSIPKKHLVFHTKIADFT